MVVQRNSAQREGYEVMEGEEMLSEGLVTMSVERTRIDGDGGRGQ